MSIEANASSTIPLIKDLLSSIQAIVYHEKKKGMRANTWKATPLNAVLTERIEKNSSRRTVCSVSVRQGIINQVEYLGRSFAAKDISNYNIVKHGDLVYTKSPTGDFPFGIVKRGSLVEDVSVSPLYGVYSPISDDIGIILHFYFMQPKNALNYLHPLVQKGAKNTINITNKRFLENTVPLPLAKEEAYRLSKTLQSVQSRIELELAIAKDYYKEKSFLLRHMFI